MQRVFWAGATWALRTIILLSLIWVLAYLERSDWRSLAITIAVAVGLFVLQRIAHRQALGWIVDDNGERQKVTSWSRGHAIFTATTRSQRIVEEAQARDERRKKLLWMAALAAGLGAFAWYAWPHIRSSDLLAMLFGLACLFGSFAVIGWFANFLNELLYLTGWQDMRGAKVLDPAPSRPGLEEVAQQKTHGDGRVASEAEALSLLDRAT